MSGRQVKRAQSRKARPSEKQWVDFADAVLEIAREIQFRGYRSPEAISLTQSEGTVMRYLFRNPGALPSQVAFATGLQRTNLSTVLRGLEDKELIKRSASPDDRRSVHIHPTQRAVDNYKLVRHEWAAAVAAAAEDDPAVEKTLPLLTKVQAGLVRQRQSDNRR